MSGLSRKYDRLLTSWGMELLISFGGLGFGCHWNLCMSHLKCMFFQSWQQIRETFIPYSQTTGTACGLHWDDVRGGLRLFRLLFLLRGQNSQGWAWGKQSSEETTNCTRLSSPFAAFEQRQRIWRPLDLCAPGPIGPRTFSRQADLFDFWGTSVRFVKCSIAQLGPFCYYKSVCNSGTDQVDRKKHGEFWRPQPCTPWDAAAFGWWCKWRPPSPKEGQRGEEDWGDWGFFRHVYDFCGLSFFMTACVASLGVSSHCERAEMFRSLVMTSSLHDWKPKLVCLKSCRIPHSHGQSWSSPVYMSGSNLRRCAHGRPPKGGRPGRQRLRRSCGFVGKW